MTTSLVIWLGRRSFFLAAALAVVGLPGEGFAQVTHGFAGGDRVLYIPPAPAVTVNLTAGSGWVDSQVYQNSAAVVITPAALAASTAYYCYIQNSQTAMFVGFNPTSFLAWCPVPAVAPTPDGHPSVAITAGGYAANTNALFVGSFITGPAVAGAVSIVPFYRNGEQVILTPLNTDVGGAIDLGVDSLTSSILSAAWNEVSFAPSPLPASASQVIVDVFPHSYESIAHNLCILDPNQVPAGANPITTCQGQQMVNASAVPGANGQYAWANYRIEANLDANRLMWFGADGALQGFGTLFYFIAVYRGYVEPVNHMVPR